MVKNKKNTIISVLLGILLICVTFGATYAFFNYTRTGTGNSVAVGRMFFESSQNGQIELTNVIPISSSSINDSENPNVDEITINVRGDTAYEEGIEYLIEVTNVNSNISKVPITLNITPSTNLGVANNDYFNNRGGDNSLYKVEINEIREDNQQIMVGYIAPGETGINGNIVIKAYINADNIVVSDTFQEGDTVNFIGQDPISLEGKTVLTTEEWNNINGNNALSFKIKVEARGGIWVEEPLTFDKKLLKSANEKTTCMASTAKKEKYVLKSNLSADLINQCVNYLTNSSNYGNEEDNVEEGESYASFCQGTGTFWEDDFQTWLDEEYFYEEDIEFFEENNMIEKEILNIGYDDGVIYFTGDNDCINFNYVWYSGKMWRITSIYDDGTLKMVTDNNIVSLNYNVSENSTFVSSYVYQWLNEDFLDTLYNYENIIDTTHKWNVTSNSGKTALEKLVPETLVNSNVGLLNSYEYNISDSNSGSTGESYLNIHYSWWLLTPGTSTKISYVNSNGAMVAGTDTSNGYGVRPVVYLKANLEVTGNGSKENPYRIKGDKEVGKNNDLLLTRISGEYIKFANENGKYRIIGNDNDSTKIVAIDYADNGNSRKIVNTLSGYNDIIYGQVNEEGNWYNYLNTVWYPQLVSSNGNLFVQGIYYIPRMTSGFYKHSICDSSQLNGDTTKGCVKTSDSYYYNVGLLRNGEMFATQQGTYSSAKEFRLISAVNGSSATYAIKANGEMTSEAVTTSTAARPTLYLKGEIKIISGKGTEIEPYVVGL